MLLYWVINCLRPAVSNVERYLVMMSIRLCSKSINWRGEEPSLCILKAFVSGARAVGLVNGKTNGCPSRFEYISHVPLAWVSVQVWLSSTFMLILMPTAPHWLTMASATLCVSLASWDAPSWMTIG